MTYEATRVSRRDTVNQCAPNVKELASATHSVRTTGVAQLGTGIYVVLVNESEAHIL